MSIHALGLAPTDAAPPAPVAAPLRRVDRSALVAPAAPLPAYTASQQRLDDLAAHPEAPPDDFQLSAIADKAFRSRPVTVDNAAQLGMGVYGVVHASQAVPKTFAGLLRPDLPLPDRVAVAGKLLRETAWLASSGAAAIRGLRLAQQEIRRHIPQLERVRPLNRLAEGAETPALTRLADKAKVVGAVGGLTLATVALPTLAKSAVTRTGAAIATVSRSDTSKDERLSAVKDAAYANAGTLFALTTIPTAIRTLASSGAAAGAIGRSAGRLAAAGTFQQAESISGTLAPIADLTLMTADAIHLYQTLRDPDADRMAKFQAGFNVTLDAAKISLHVLPQSRFARTAYTAAGLIQLGLGIHALVKRDDPPAPAAQPAQGQPLRPLRLQQN